MPTEPLSWKPDSICLHPSTLDVRAIATAVYSRTCRTAFDAPGFCVVNVGITIGSVVFRQLMVDLKREMATTKGAKLTKMVFDDQPHSVIGSAIGVQGIHEAQLLT